MCLSNFKLNGSRLEKALLYTLIEWSNIEIIPAQWNKSSHSLWYSFQIQPYCIATVYNHSPVKVYVHMYIIWLPITRKKVKGEPTQKHLATILITLLSEA